jgi:hypothetical protein
VLQNRLTGAETKNARGEGYSKDEFVLLPKLDHRRLPTARRSTAPGHRVEKFQEQLSL